MTNNYWLGDQITIYETFTVNDVLTDPTTTTFIIVRPDGTEDTYVFGIDGEVTNPSVGYYECAYMPLTIGHYDYRVVAAGNVIAAIENEFHVYSRVPDVSDVVYVTPLELAAVLRISAEGPLLDDLDRACNSASRAVDEICDSCFALRDDSNDEVRYFTPLSSLLCQIDDAAIVTSVRLDMNEDGTYELDWTLDSDFVLERSSVASLPPAVKPFNRIKVRQRSGKFFPRGDQVVEVTGRFGWSSTPWQIVEATGLLAQQLFKRRQEAPFGIVSYGIDQPTAVKLARSDAHLCMLLDPFGRTELG